MKIEEIENALSTFRKYYGEKPNIEIECIQQGDDGIRIVCPVLPFDVELPEQKKKTKGYLVHFPRSAQLYVDTTSKEYALRYAISKLVVERADDGH
jgi:hypothetical protein